jgi:hypothetical protein
MQPDASLATNTDLKTGSSLWEGLSGFILFVTSECHNKLVCLYLATLSIDVTPYFKVRKCDDYISSTASTAYKTQWN